MENIFIFLIGASVGSFLNVLIDRLPKGQSIAGRSHCDYCRHKLNGLDLIPIISYLILKGRCRYCRKKLSFYYPLVELLTGVIFIIIFNLKFEIFNQFSNNLILNWLLEIGLFSSLIVIFFSDLKYQIIPDSIQLVLFIFAFLVNFFSPDYSISNLLNYLKSGFLVMSPILLLFLITRGRGMGFGDVKLSFIIGFLLGIKAGLLALYFGFIFGAIVGLVLIILGKKKLRSKIAFGPFLVLGILTVIFWQREILHFIKTTYGF